MTMKHFNNPVQAISFQQIQEGDEKAFEKVFHYYYRHLVIFAMRYLTDRDAAENLVQNVFVKLWDKRKELQIQSIKGYLMVAVRNQCHNELKHQQVDKKFQQSVHFEETDAEAEFPDEEVMSRIYAVIEQMPEQRRKIFKMNRLDGMKYKEIAAALHLSPKTVEVQIGHALKFLRENLSSLKTRIYHHN